MRPESAQVMMVGAASIAALLSLIGVDHDLPFAVLARISHRTPAAG